MGSGCGVQLKRMQPRLQLKCTHNLTRSKSVLTRRRADMNATGQMKEKGLEKHQEDKMDPWQHHPISPSGIMYLFYAWAKV